MEAWIGETVIYRSADGVDMPAIITGLVSEEGDGDWAHLHAFPPPGAANDVHSYQWGTRQHQGDGEPLTRTWRFRERVA